VPTLDGILLLCGFDSDVGKVLLTQWLNVSLVGLLKLLSSCIYLINIVMSVHSDKNFWINLQWPAAPNQDDYKVFASYCTGCVLLLGSTRLLLPLATEAWDLEPKYNDVKIKNKDWFNLDKHFDTIIIDGGLAFGKEFTERVLSVVLPNCNRFIARTFLNPNWPTKYAQYFPRAEELTPVPQEHPVNEVYSFYIWNNQ